MARDTFTRLRELIEGGEEGPFKDYLTRKLDRKQSDFYSLGKIHSPGRVYDFDDHLVEAIESFRKNFPKEDWGEELEKEWDKKKDGPKGSPKTDWGEELEKEWDEKKDSPKRTKKRGRKTDIWDGDFEFEPFDLPDEEKKKTKKRRAKTTRVDLPEAEEDEPEYGDDKEPKDPKARPFWTKSNPLPVWIVGSDIGMGGGKGGRGGEGGEGGKGDKERMSFFGALAAGIDPTLGLLFTGNPAAIAAGILIRAVKETDKIIGDERFGANMVKIVPAKFFGELARGNVPIAAIAELVSMGPHGPALLAAQLGARGLLIDKTLEKSQLVHDSNMRFAEMSGSMANVMAQQEIREMRLLRERGERRAPWARELEESRHRLAERIAPWEDAFARFHASRITDMNEAMLRALDAFERSPIGQAIMRLFRVELGGRHEGVVLDWVEDIRNNPRGGRVDDHGRPPRFWGPRPPMGGGGP